MNMLRVKGGVLVVVGRKNELLGTRKMRGGVENLYHVELPGQLSKRSSSIVFFIKELENIKKRRLISKIGMED
jgi:hypothetical protein